MKAVHHVILQVVFWCGVSVLRARTEDTRGNSPNIVFILADDLGWSDLSCYGHPWHDTPNLDRLAGEGMRFTDAYAPAPICSASRASILTGKTTARLGFEFVVKEKPGEQVIEPAPPLRAPPFTLALPLEEVTIAEHLEGAGYDTAFFGKWHLNPHHEGRYLAWSPTHGPRQQGFRIAGEDFGSHPYNRREPPEPVEDGVFYPDGLTRRAAAYLEQEHERPFFLMLSHFYVHTPVRTSCEWLRRKYDARVPPGSPRRAGRIEYAAFVETLDHHVGELLDVLAASSHAENTLVVFTSDNGGHPEYVANNPLRGSKWNLYEGGIRVPMLMRWPGRIRDGAVCRIPVIGYDLFPTFAEVGGRAVGGDRGPLDGRSLVPLVTGGEVLPDRPLYWHFPYYHPERRKFGESLEAIGVDDFAVSQTRPHSALRRGKWKLIRFDEDGRTELYDLQEDPSESRDLGLQHAGEGADLADSLRDYLEKVDARRPVRR